MKTVAMAMKTVVAGIKTVVTEMERRKPEKQPIYRFHIPGPSPIRIRIFDSQGVEVYRIVRENRTQMDKNTFIGNELRRCFACTSHKCTVPLTKRHPENVRISG